MMQVQARAKINLCLEVLGVLPGGYHEVATLLHTIALSDTLSFEPAPDLTLHCDPALGPLEENLVLRAARLLQQEIGSTRGAAIVLHKGIPVAAGLGGGSSDAAATLLALNTLWGLGLSLERLAELAARLGADVPFFLQSGCALAQGRGNVLTPLPPLQGWWAVVLHPPISLEGKTGFLYRQLAAADYTGGQGALALAAKLRQGVRTLANLAGATNAFERVAGAAFPGLDAYWQAFLAAGAPFARLSGSGPSLFTLAQSQTEAQDMAVRLRAQGYETYDAALE
ncbi:MAG: 4-(cytidine 5'-diphospho)-2-C-methyl-D-erythritol kinase [Chloroflexi bacterium]|nr:4-(cytidine 5'-diphospho)-2-C-methyl-D-erythritol kinase [Chloroflexota bacterium]